MKKWYIYLIQTGACFMTILVLSNLFDKNIDYVFSTVVTTIYLGMTIVFDCIAKNKK